jgi:hypothetical protein
MFQQFKVEHPFWEGNKCVDALARKGCMQSEDFFFALQLLHLI